jgi:hypothetical protein
MLTGEPRLARAEIAKHVSKIILTPEGRAYIASGTWDLLGGVAVRMVPGARFAPFAPRNSHSQLQHDIHFGVMDEFSARSQ